MDVLSLYIIVKVDVTPLKLMTAVTGQPLYSLLNNICKTPNLKLEMAEKHDFTHEFTFFENLVI
jgi:hypothetical protein